jgi:sodium-dependent dicarboxylate transporter 2/3/5
MALAVAAVTTSMPELAINLPSVEMLLPVLGEAAVSLQVHPLQLMVPATLAASCAFMLPVATAPNAIVFSSGRIRIHEMLRAGLWMNLISLVLISVWAQFLIAVLLWAQ